MFKIKFPKLKKNYRRDNFKISPKVCWQGIVCLFFILIIISAIFAFSLFKETSPESVFISAGVNGQVEKEKKEKINNVLNYFSERELKSKDALNSSIPFVDPSL